MTRVGKQTEVISSYQNGPVKDRPQATSEQLRLAKLTQGIEDQDQMRDKVRKVIELTKCTEQQALLALHDCDQEVMSAVNHILDGSATKDGEWITKQGKKAKRAAAQQQTHESVNGEMDGDESCSDQAGGGMRGAKGRGGFRSSSDQPPRFTGRGPPPQQRRNPPNSTNYSGKGNKENETNSSDSRGRGRGRSSSGRESSERGRFRSKGKKEGEGGFGYWQGGTSSNTWDNRMATEVVPDPISSNTWDNRMAEHLTAQNQARAPPQQSSPPQQPQTPATQKLSGTSKEWSNNNNTTTTTTTSDEWNQDDTESWNKQTLVFTATNSSNRKSPSPATAIAQQIQQDTQRQTTDTTTTGTPVYRTTDSGPSSVGDMGSLPGSVSAASWTQQATNSLKNELGIGKQSTTVSASMPTTSSHGGVSDLQRTAKVEMPFDVGLGHGSMDIQFGFADDLGASVGGLDYSAYGQRLQNNKPELSSQNGVGKLMGVPKETPEKQQTVYQSVGSLNSSGTSGTAAVPQHNINISPPKIPTPAGLSQLSSSTGGRPPSSSFSESSASQQDTFNSILNHQVPTIQQNVSIPPPNLLSTLNTSVPSNVSWNSNVMTSSLNSKTTTSTNTKPSVPTNVYNQSQAPFMNYPAGIPPYMNLYGTATAGLPMRPEDMLQLQTGMILNGPFDFSAVTPFLPQVSSVGSSVGSRDNSSFTTVPAQSEMKPLSVGAGTSMQAQATVAPPPGFTQPSQSNAAQAAQLIAAQQAAHQLTGAYGGVQLPLFMQPQHQFSKAQNTYPAMLQSYDMNDMELKGGGGTYGNSSQANKALLSGPLAGLGGLDPKSYAGAPPVNKSYDTKFGSGVTNTPPPGMGSMAGFTGFPQPSGFPYAAGGGAAAYLGAPPMLHSPAGINYAPPALGTDQRGGAKGSLGGAKYGSYGNWNNGQQNS